MKLHKILFVILVTVCISSQNIHAAQENIYMNNGRLYFPDGKELSLWGVNFQPCLSWEYNGRLRPAGVQLNSADLKKVTDTSLDELQRMGVNMIRCHLTPADFTDANGNLVQTVYLDILDYMVAEAAKRNIYVYLTFINHMGNYFISTSFLNNNAAEYRQKWIFDKSVVAKSKTYVTQLLNRTNPYMDKPYKSIPAIALWELINEPDYYSYTAIQSTAYYSDFLTWITANRSGVNNANTYYDYRKQLVLNYINEMHTLIRAQGALQPVVWNCNWNGFRTGNEDVFEAIAQSDAEVVSFCNYPGQNLVPQDYWSHPVDLTASDYSSYFKNLSDTYNGYGWAKSFEFENKAKVVYEFEELFNQSSYLYPVMAQYYRSFGVQAATMWTYALGKSAPYINGSHFLSLTCTPAKAASFMVAHELFDNTPLYTVYNSTSTNEQTGTNFALSKSKDLSMFVTADKFYYSGDVTNWLPFTVSKKVKNIIGRGNSPLVSYNGTGDYTLKDINNELFITIEPNSIWLRLPWKNDTSNSLVTQLDYTTSNTMSITLDNWGSAVYTLLRINGTQREKVVVLSDLKNISIIPGNYVVVRDDNTAVSQTSLPDNIHWSNGRLMVEQGKFDSVRIYSLNGKVLLSHSMTNQNEVLLSTLSKGIYLVSLVGKESVTLKINI